jgi:hypothetical protein
MSNGGIIFDADDYEHQSRWYCRVCEIKVFELGAVSCGITFIKRPQRHYLSINVYRQFHG